MSKKERVWLVFYDISDRRRLYYAAKICGDYAVRVQNSVYEMRGQESQMREFIRLMEFYLDKEEDSLFILELCSEDFLKREKYGVESSEEKIYEQYYQIL